MHLNPKLPSKPDLMQLQDTGKEIAKPITPPSESASEEARIAESQNGASDWHSTTDEEIDGTRVGSSITLHGKDSGVETGDSNVIPDSPDMCDNDIQDDQNDVECDNERAALANLIANLKLDTGLRGSLKVQGTYEISVVQAKHDELVKQSLLTRSHYEGLVKEKTKVITDLKLKEEKDIDKMISMEHQLKFLNEIVYKQSQSIQTIHMLAPKCPTFNGRPTFANPMYLKKAQYEHPGLYAITQDQSDPATRLIPDREGF
ncbi:hypothetical protein Tco_1343845 [Tanacetum coccineum]